MLLLVQVLQTEELKRVENLRKDIKVLRNIFKKSSLVFYGEHDEL